jgi:hypothetical protein
LTKDAIFIINLSFSTLTTADSWSYGEYANNQSISAQRPGKASKENIYPGTEKLPSEAGCMCQSLHHHSQEAELSFAQGGACQTNEWH